jgi:hypothetical protein
MFVRLDNGQPVERISAARLRRIIRDANPLANPPALDQYLTVPEALASDYAPLVETRDDPPAVAFDQRAVLAYQMVDGVWHRNWTIEQLSAEDAAAAFESLRGALWDRVKALREAHSAAGVTVPDLGSFDSDPGSCLRLSGATTDALLAQMNSEPYSVRWTLKDNSEVALGAPQIKAVGRAVVAHIAACHDRSKDLRALIEAATDPSELAAIDVEADWP